MTETLVDWEQGIAIPVQSSVGVCGGAGSMVLVALLVGSFLSKNINLVDINASISSDLDVITKDLKRTKELIYSAAVLLEQKYRSQPVFI